MSNKEFPPPKALWSGRFSKQTDESVNAFNSSIAFDFRMYAADILGSIAHAEMLGECGIIAKSESIAITAGLRDILCDIETGELLPDDTAEDVHMFIESELIRRIGSTGKRLHTARSRNDQVATDFRLYLRGESYRLMSLISDLLQALKETADCHTKTVMPGYTHLQPAQPVTFAHHLMAYHEMFLRDKERLTDLQKRLDICPLGSGALAGTTYPIDRFSTTRKLEFERPCANSLDGVASRDFAIEFTSDLAIIMVNLSRISEEIILWCSHEFKFVTLDDAFATGSSIMPQKKNPDVCELIRGKSGRVFGDVMTLLTVMKGLPLAYNKDMQEDKEVVFDALDTVTVCIETFIPMFRSMTIHADNMRGAAARGFINATDCADYLTKKGMPFRDAYRLTGELVAYCVEHDTVLEKLPLSVYKEKSVLFEDDVYDAIDLTVCAFGRNCYGAAGYDGGV
ncbi:argininosuccinate lyase [Clostridia bacterium]|nr:argininosuccinate lyase [Clostridia bacterium]